jgi:hypothetical protein
MPSEAPDRRISTLRLERRGLALRFALIIGDPRLSGARHVSCAHDTVTVTFPEAHIVAELASVRTELGVLTGLRLHARPGAANRRRPVVYAVDRVLTGRAGGPEQREALLHEILAARTLGVQTPGAARPGLTPLHVLAAAV